MSATVVPERNSSAFPLLQTRPRHAGLVLLPALLLVTSLAHAQTFTNQTIQSTANIYGAGRSGSAATPSPGGTTSGAPGDPGGTAAPMFGLAAGVNRVLTFSSVTGTLTFDYPDNFAYFDADGGTYGSSFASSFQGISGIEETDRIGSLVGVFINGTPAGYADGSSGSDATALSYSSTIGTKTSYAATMYSPLLNQTFFVGDGLTGDAAGAIQQFYVPNGATALVLGFSDAPNYSGAPGSYNDNAGSLVASFSIVSGSAPEPGSLLYAALAAGTALPLLNRRRR